MSFYITLSSDSSASFFPENKISHFSVQLPHSICLDDDEYEVAVCEVFTPKCDPNADSTPCYLYTDLVKPQIMSDRSVRLLRILESPSIRNHTIFSALYYIPVEKRNISTITLTFATKFGNRYPFPAANIHPSIVILHFRKVI